MPRGLCIWLTGPSGAGKSTLTAELVPMLRASGRSVAVLDVMPKVMAKQRFERSSRAKLLRKAFVAGRIADVGGIAICVTVSARPEVRTEARATIGPDRFIEVLVQAPPDVTATRKAARNRKPRLGRRLRRMFRPALDVVASVRRRNANWDTGSEDLAIDSTVQSPSEAARAVIDLLRVRDLLSDPESDAPPARGRADDGSPRDPLRRGRQGVG